MKNLLLIFIIQLSLFAGSLELERGHIKAHTEMLLDTTIDPINKSLMADLTMAGSDIESLRGRIWVDLNMFMSDMSERDAHMYDALESKKFILATFIIDSVRKTEGADRYEIKGKLDFHGVQKELKSIATISLLNKQLSFNATATLNMSDYGIEMPCMMFMCVEEEVNLLVDAIFSK